MITPPVLNKPSQHQNKCIIVWLMILSVLLIAMLAGLVFIGLKLHQTNCSCDAGAQAVVGKRSVQLNNKTALTSVVPSYNEMVMVEFIKVYTNKAKEEIKCQLQDELKEQCGLIEKKILKKYAYLDDSYSTVNWTALTTSFVSLDTGSPGKVVQIQLSSIGVSTKAKEVLVYAIVATGTSYPQDGTGVIEVYSQDYMKQFVYIYSYNANDVSYNSDNLWVPIGKNRILYGRYAGTKITGNRFALMKVIGYR